MDRRIVSKLGAAAALGTLLTLVTGCQDLNSLVTGEKFLLAPKGSPRVEAEVDFKVGEAFYDSLEGVERQAFEARLDEIVLSLADVGLRFYPVPVDAYGEGDVRPERRLLIEVDQLTVAVDAETVEEDGQPLRIVANVDGVSCQVRARVEKRRSGAPALVVGTAAATGRVRHNPDPAELASVPTLGVRAAVVGHEGLRVAEKDVLDAFEEGLVDALRSLVKAVDRDLAAVPAH